MGQLLPDGKSQRGIALLGAMVMVLLLSLLAATLLNLAEQESVSVAAGREAAVAQQLADAAGDLVLAWFHGAPIPPQAASMVAKRNRTATGAPSFFDADGRSQFIGSADQPDLLLDARNPTDERVLNDPDSGLFRTLRQFGTVQELKLYAPTNPGLLCTVDATVRTQGSPSFKQAVTMQLGALDRPPLRAAVQVGQRLGLFQVGKESPVDVHWGDLKVKEDLVVRRSDDIPTLTMLTPVTGQPYDHSSPREDRWAEVWVGGQILVTQPPPGQAAMPPLPTNAHPNQHPLPGLQLDSWPYERLKRLAQQHGSYFVIDRAGLLYPDGRVETGRGLSPDDVFRSRGIGDQRGLIFIDTLDQTAPRSDNLGVITLRLSYLEGIVVVLGHVVLAPGGPGQGLSALSPPKSERDGAESRISVQLSGVHLNGVLYAGGNITVDGAVRVYGAVAAAGTIASATSGGALEVWYNHDLGQGLFQGLPVVYRAPGTWMSRY